jgi:hypothetical protein
MSESVRGRLLPKVERREWIGKYAWELLVKLALVWILVFALLAVLLSFGLSVSHGALSIAEDAARWATVVVTAIFILLNLLPAE